MAYAASVWLSVKHDYETGNFESLEKLHEKYSEISIDAIKRHAAKYNWEKGRLAPLIEQTAQQQLVNALAKKFNGNIFGKISDAIEQLLAATKTVVIPSNSTDGSGNRESGFAEVMPDYKAINDACKLILDITGAVAPQKTEIEITTLLDKSVRIIAEVINRFVQEERRIEAKEFFQYEIQRK